MLQYIVTGTGRSGTVYMARLLTSLGLPCGHESFFTPFSKKPFSYSNPILSPCSINDCNYGPQGNWVDVEQLTADSSWFAPPFLNEKNVKKTAIIHVVRNPLLVMSSILLYRNNKNFIGKPHTITDKFRYKWIPEIYKFKNPVVRAAHFWLQWHQMIERTSVNRKYLRCIIDNQPSQKLFDFLNISKTDDHFKNKTINHHLSPKYRGEGKNITWQDLPLDIRKKVSDLAEKYGVL